MINIKLHKNEIEYIKMGVESNAWFGNDEKLAERILKKLDKALTIPVVVGTSVCDEPDEPVERCKCCKSFHEPDVCCY